ncbi:MFS transporter, partial [Pseudomonas sp. GP01-A1]
VVGGLSDHFAHSAMYADGAQQMTEAYKAVGLHDAMYLIPVALFLTMLFLFQASRSFVRDAQRMKDGLGVAEVPARAVTA